MAPRADAFDLAALKLTAGEGRRIELAVALDPFDLGGERYQADPALVPAKLDVSRTTGDGYALRLHFQVQLTGPCTRCLADADPTFDVDAREISQPGGGEDLTSPYLEHGQLDLRSWARDALALTLPTQILCRPDCAGLCAICGADLNTAGPEHQNEREPDPRWAKLSELRLDP